VSSLALASIMSFLNTSWVSREKVEADLADWGQNEREIVNSVILSSLQQNKHQAKTVIAGFQEFLLYVDINYYFLNAGQYGCTLVNLVFMENVLSSLEVVGMENLDTTDSSKMITLLFNDLTTGESSFTLDTKKTNTSVSLPFSVIKSSPTMLEAPSHFWLSQESSH
jgi:hypothetical protein